MTDETILTNAILVLPDATLHGTLVDARRPHRRGAAAAHPMPSPRTTSMATT